ncbi:hypothetical protein JOF56_009900 [Kibdelosporangium banguiense]|uniref:Uncharacterized protein n=1 Tax=Kibdelosporangium banguiense TaxID=1365924 RepID=A0ABS4TYN7_9PSEU|nr:hypothetical protein [Kibdelosporangium banguiense]MBP2329515.1 hypothetical protein [Kibdelosporangium banguiense]
MVTPGVLRVEAKSSRARSMDSSVSNSLISLSRGVSGKTSRSNSPDARFIIVSAAAMM